MLASAYLYTHVHHTQKHQSGEAKRRKRGNMRAGAQQLCGNVREIGPKGKNSERMHTHANRPREHCHGPWPGAGVVLGFSFLVSVRVLECVCVVGTGVPFKLHMESTSHAVGTPGPECHFCSLSAHRCACLLLSRCRAVFTTSWILLS